MMEVGNHDDYCPKNEEGYQGVVDAIVILTPVGDFEPRYAIVLDNIGRAKGGTGIVDSPDHEGDANVGEDNGLSLSRSE